MIASIRFEKKIFVQNLISIHDNSQQTKSRKIYSTHWLTSYLMVKY